MRCGVFPGQGNQYIGMGMSLYDSLVTAVERFDEASDVSKTDLKEIACNGPEELQRDVVNLELLTFTHSCIVYDVLSQSGNANFDYLAGHSIGEIAALYAAGYFTFPQGIEVVMQRAGLKKRKTFRETTLFLVPGWQEDEVKKFCSGINGEFGIALSIALYNSPGNYVIGGLPHEIKIGLERLPERFRKRAIGLPVAGPFHTAAYKDMAENEYRSFLESMGFNEPLKDVPVLSNVTTLPYSRETIVDNMVKQIYMPVLWQQSVQKITKECNEFLEMGPGDSLAKMNRRNAPDARTVSISEFEHLKPFID